ncbi:MAG: diacylglycerol kinase family lipid kinase [Deltaproteobacteria bacterium]|nr:MAG: diacylglycerol kinase family lipid kinase [Deltaproteobacteria bacterium]
MNATLVLNPAAGGGRAGKQAKSAVARLQALGFDVTLVQTAGPGDATRLAREATTELVIAAGGDGTTFEVINGLATREDRPKLGILPLGTGNSFLRDFAITCTDDAYAALARGKTRSIDLVRIEHAEGALHYVNLLSLGFTADAGHVTNERYKAFGALGYVLATLQCLVRLQWPRFPYRLDDGELDERDCTLLSFSNSQYTGGTMQMAPGADPTDGELDVIHIGPLGRRRFLAAFPKIFQGTHVHMPEIEHHRAREVRFDLAEPAACMIDGEVLTLALERLVVEPGALELLA